MEWDGFSILDDDEFPQVVNWVFQQVFLHGLNCHRTVLEVENDAVCLSLVHL